MTRIGYEIFYDGSIDKYVLVRVTREDIAVSEARDWVERVRDQEVRERRAAQRDGDDS